MECIHKKEPLFTLMGNFVFRCDEPTIGKCVATKDQLQQLSKVPGLNGACEGCALKQLPIIPATPVAVIPREKFNFCYFTGTNRDSDKPIIATMLKSMRAAGVAEDLHVFATSPIEGTIHHQINDGLDWRSHMAKLDFARQLADSSYDFIVWLDSDNYFVRDPGDLSRFMRNNPLWVCMESDMTQTPKTKEDGWYHQKHEYIEALYRREGVATAKVWNSNGGLFMLKTSVINDIADRMEQIHLKWKNGLWRQSHGNDEVILACLGAIFVDDPELNTFEATKDLWACDWAGVWSNKLPDGTMWKYTDWMFGTNQNINPCIIHCMRLKDILRHGSNIDPVKSMATRGEPVRLSNDGKPLTTIQKAKSMAQVVATTVANGGKLVNQEQMKERLAKCEPCPNYTGTGCTLCGCAVNRDAVWSNKLAHASSVCPAYRPQWGAIEIEG